MIALLRMGIDNSAKTDDLYIIRNGVWQTAGGNWASRGVSYNTLTTNAVAPVRSDGSGYLGFNTPGNNTALRSGNACSGNYIDFTGYKYLKVTYDYRIPPMDISKADASMRVYFGAQNAAQFAATSGYSGMTLVLQYLKSDVGYTGTNQTDTIDISSRNELCKPSFGFWWGYNYTGSDANPGYVRIKNLWLARG
jgi:hypothetical protein